jgi:hypothetical protein
MKRFIGLLVVLAGCQQQDTTPVAEKPTIPQPAQAPPPRTLQASAEIEFSFSAWPTATRSPIDVSPHVSAACRAPVPVEHNWAEVGGENRHGPHFKHTIVVRISPEQAEEFKTLNAPLSVGTIVVKEKHADGLAKGPPNEYGAMIKHEPGYDPQHGDWEYIYVEREPEKKVTRGRLESCINCHEHAKNRDYVFRTYLKADGVADW